MLKSKKNKNYILVVLMVCATIFSCTKEEIAPEPDNLQQQNQTESITSDQTRLAVRLMCFSPACGAIQLSSTLNTGIDCYYTPPCSSASKGETLTFGPSGDVFMSDCYLACDDGDILYSNSQQEAIVDLAVAFAEANAPICPITGEPKNISNIEFTWDKILCCPFQWLEMTVTYGCC